MALLKINISAVSEDKLRDLLRCFNKRIGFIFQEICFNDVVIRSEIVSDPDVNDLFA